MKKAISIVLFCCFVFLSKAQKNEVNLVFGGGPSYFANDNTNRRIDNFITLGVNVLINKKNRAVIFNPGLSIYINDYHYKLSYDREVHLMQRATALDLNMLMKISKKNFFRVGLSLSRMEHSSIMVIYNDNSGRFFGYSDNATYESYSCASFEAAVIAGVSLPFKLFKKDMKFDIGIYQNASALVNNDYYYNDGYTGEKTKVLGVKSLPTKLLFALEINLLKKKKTKKEIEESEE